jgi:hypothetical protein
LEKLRPEIKQDTLGELIRSPLLDGCHSAFVIQLWMLYGPESFELYPNVEVLRIAVDPEPGFAREIVARRAGPVLAPDALDAIARYSGGVTRDALQLASKACTEAMDDRVVPAESRHIEKARESLRRHYQAALSDDPPRAERFLDEIRRTGKFPADPELRNLMLGHGIILPNADGSFRVHPIVG